MVNPRRPNARPWLNLLPDEVDPQILQADAPDLVVWSSLWPSRPNDQVRFELRLVRNDTALTFRLLTPDDPPDASKLGHLRHRLNHLLFADLRYSYGQ